MKFPGYALCLLAFAVPPSSPAAAADIAEARKTGAVVGEALTLGARGDWDGALRRVAGRGGLARDIILWRRLDVGKGSVAEYNAHVARRPDWPGRTRLKSLYTKEAIQPKREAPTGVAGKNLEKFDALYRKRDYDAAGAFLADITGEVRALGVPAHWSDRRRRLARRAAGRDEAQRAYALASRHFLTPDEGYAYADLEWLSGWIALTMLKDPGRAAGHFERFAGVVRTPISLGRAGYWTGRAYEALGDRPAAERWYRVGADYQTSFYGQLAAARIAAAPNLHPAKRPPVPKRARPAAEDEGLRLAAVLHFAGWETLAAAVFGNSAKRLKRPAEFEALGAFAFDLDSPHYAVRVGKAAALKGIVLPRFYYPMHDLAKYAERIEPALAMSVARQETELNPGAVSPAGARGLMQLLPTTARDTARRTGEKYSRARLTRDWRYNARLGQAYLARRVDQFDGSYVLAAAAYNAGARRVDRWIEDGGNPLTSGGGVEGLIDWMEKIPLRETRNYVQRVMEGLYVYRTRISGRAEPMTIERDLSRGMR